MAGKGNASQVNIISGPARNVGMYAYTGFWTAGMSQARTNYVRKGIARIASENRI